MSRQVNPDSLHQRVLASVENDGLGTVDEIALRVGADRKRVYWALANLAKQGAVDRVKPPIVYRAAEDF